MNIEDLSFNVKYNNGEELINDITAVIPNMDSPDEPYVTYTDYLLDENDEFMTYYGKITMINGQPTLTRNLSEYEIMYIQDSLKDEIVKEVNATLFDTAKE